MFCLVFHLKPFRLGIRWHTPLIPAPGRQRQRQRQRQVDLCEFKASLVYTVSSRIPRAM